MKFLQRFNVTITRAKSLLIVVGNPKVLQIDPCWLEFLQYCKKNEAFRGDKFTLSNLSEAEKKILLTNRLQTKKENKKQTKKKKGTGKSASPSLVNRKLEAGKHNNKKCNIRYLFINEKTYIL